MLYYLMLQTAELDFSYPDELVALKPKERGTSRILFIPRDSNQFRELNWMNLLAFFKKGDTLVLNDTEVLWARLVIPKAQGKSGEIFFLKTMDSQQHWQVLSRALNLKEKKVIELPGGIKATVLKAGRVSELKIHTVFDLKKYFAEFGHVPLPPYIENLRSSVKDEDFAVEQDKNRYQTAWAKNWGSVAAPTASLHFSQAHLDQIKKQGVKIAWTTLHVGAGTFMPIETETLEAFQIHSEVVNVPPQTCHMIRESQATGKKIWACGTTVLRALETAVWATGTAETNMPLIAPFYGETSLYIHPGSRFAVVDGLLTNFHQPKSSLLALAATFSIIGEAQTISDKRARVKKILDAYQFAIAKKFRLFSYGDLTVLF